MRNLVNTRHRFLVAAMTLIGAIGAPVLAQFDTPAGTDIKEKIAGNLLSAEGAPAPEPGDQIGVFFQNKICGKFVFSGTTATREFSVVIFGDDPATSTVVEGAKSGSAVEFRFYDVSANAVRTDVRVENLQGEAFNYKYAGVDVPTLPVDLPGLDLTPTRSLNLRVGVTSGGGGGGDDDPVNKYDVDGNGKVETDDAAMVLRIVTGAGRGLSEEVISRADVTGDSRVDTSDAIEIMRNRP